MPDTLVDNDIVIKAVSYGVTDQVLALLRSHNLSPAILAVSRFMISNKLKRAKTLGRKGAALVEFDRTLPLFEIIEPTNDEVLMAAEFEDAATLNNLELDSGESQLLAILLNRAMKLMLTGDKRAILAIEAIAGDRFGIPKVACLEQLMNSLIVDMGIEALRSFVCAEKEVDRALTICFRCNATNYDRDLIVQGLKSYIGDVRKNAPRVLITSDGLVDLVS